MKNLKHIADLAFSGNMCACVCSRHVLECRQGARRTPRGNRAANGGATTRAGGNREWCCSCEYVGLVGAMSVSCKRSLTGSVENVLPRCGELLGVECSPWVWNALDM